MHGSSSAGASRSAGSARRVGAVASTSILPPTLPCLPSPVVAEILAGFGVLDRAAQVGETGLGADEQAVRQPARLHEFGMNLVLGVHVEPQSSQVLQAQIAVGIDRGALEPPGKIAAARS